MRDYNFLKNKFSEKNTINNIEYLEKYLKLLLEYKIDINESDIYTEKHHILPRSVFPEFENEDWNIVDLKYKDHVDAHLYLFKSINIRQYQRPLNWMLNQYKNREEISNAAKIGWINLKNDKYKYEKWRNSKSESMKKLINSQRYKDIMTEYYKYISYKTRKKRNYLSNFHKEDFFSSENQRRRTKLFWNNITDEEYTIFSNKIKEYWTDEKREDKSKQMIEHYSNPENIEKKRKESQKRWDSMSSEDRDNFTIKMISINRDEEKRRIAGDKIKNLWQNEEYLKKMKNRPHRKGKSILIIRPDGEEIIVKTMTDMEKIYEFNSYRIRKYIDTDLPIKEEDLCENKFLLNCKIKTIENG